MSDNKSPRFSKAFNLLLEFAREHEIIEKEKEEEKVERERA